MKSQKMKVARPLPRRSDVRPRYHGGLLAGPIETTLTRAQFWTIIGQAWAETDDPEEMVDRVIESLVERPLGDILGFQRTFGHLCRTIHHEIGPTLHRIAGDHPREVHSFAVWIIAQGETFFESALESPGHLEERGFDLEPLALMAAAFVAFREKTGLADMDEYLALL